MEETLLLHSPAYFVNVNVNCHFSNARTACSSSPFSSSSDPLRWC
jgi:hypothetical protein